MTDAQVFSSMPNLSFLQPIVPAHDVGHLLAAHRTYPG
jgi:hypothetical protein